MEFITVHQATIAEACPETSDVGHHTPTPNQMDTLFSPSGAGRLIAPFYDPEIVRPTDSVETLAAAAVYRLAYMGGATPPTRFVAAANPDLAPAIADLAVTGEAAYASLLAAARMTLHGVPLPEVLVLRQVVASRLEATAARLGATFLVPPGDPGVSDAVETVINRAMQVAWALNGPSAHRASARDPLGWIAVNAEVDQPRRPVNIPATPWPCADLEVPLGPLSIRTRYAVGGASEADEEVDLAMNLPRTTRPPQVDPDAEVMVFLHGHSSHLEEGTTLYEALRDQAAKAFYPRPVVMVAFDFPSNGYSQYFDHDIISPLSTTTRYVPDHPEERRFGILEFYESFVVAFVEALDGALVADGQRGLLQRVVAVIGGSMGGNLALRLAENLVTTPWWMKNAVSWSPASAYQSFGNKDYAIPSPGEEIDPIGKEALERTYDRCQEAERRDTRATFYALQLNGERLINDGTPEFEVTTRLLTVMLQPFLGGLTNFFPFIGPIVGPLLSGAVGPIAYGSYILERAANLVTIKQSDEWLRPECRAGFDTVLAAQHVALGLNERYSSIRRRTHWRVAYEQLIFSHQDVVAASGGRPCYARATTPTLLIAGGDDTVDTLTGFDIVGGVRTIAPLMLQNEGRAVIIERTGHSIHFERPAWLAREIFDYLLSRSLREVVAVSRDGGRVSRLHFRPLLRSVDAPTAIRQSLGTAAHGGYYYFLTSAGERQAIYARRYVSTTPDDVEGNNLRALPITTQPLLGYRAMRAVYGPASGFRVTHIRLRTAGPEPWRTWVSHLCNDTFGFQIPTPAAELRILEDGARYYVRHEGDDYDLHVYEYLHTNPDEREDNNLTSLPVI